MTKEEHIKFWIDSAQHDLETVDALFNSGKYDWSLFIGHLVLEKALKAIYVNKIENKIPPKIHNLVRLSEINEIQLNDEDKLFLDKINDFNIEVRYPEYKNELYKICTKDFAINYIKQIKEYFQWLKSQLK
jgi:HEPN domain-containing protein